MYKIVKEKYRGNEVADQDVRLPAPQRFGGTMGTIARLGFGKGDGLCHGGNRTYTYKVGSRRKETRYKVPADRAKFPW